MKNKWGVLSALFDAHYFKDGIMRAMPIANGYWCLLQRHPLKKQNNRFIKHQKQISIFWFKYRYVTCKIQITFRLKVWWSRFLCNCESIFYLVLSHICTLFFFRTGYANAPVLDQQLGGSCPSFFSFLCLSFVTVWEVMTPTYRLGATAG